MHDLCSILLQSIRTFPPNLDFPQPSVQNAPLPKHGRANGRACAPGSYKETYLPYPRFKTSCGCLRRYEAVANDCDCHLITSGAEEAYSEPLQSASGIKYCGLLRWPTFHKFIKPTFIVSKGQNCTSCALSRSSRRRDVMLW